MSENKASNTTVLVVDDVTDNVILISLELQNRGYRVLTACNGEEAIKVALLGKPNLILMDIAMPNMDGLAATRRIRQQDELRHIRVVALTAFDTSGFRQAASDAGFDGYLTKPIDFERLNNLLEMLLREEVTTDLSMETTELSLETTELARENVA